MLIGEAWRGWKAWKAGNAKRARRAGRVVRAWLVLDTGLTRQTRPTRLPLVERLREAEIEHLHCAVAAHPDVRGLEIAMDDPLLVCGFECLGDLRGDGQRFVERHRTARQTLDRSSPSANSMARIRWPSTATL